MVNNRYLIFLSNPLNIQVDGIEGSSPLDVHAIDAHEGISNALTAVSMNRVVIGLGYYFDLHTGVEDNPVGTDGTLYCNSE